MSFRRVAEKTWRDNVLFSVLVELTYRCNLDCFFCFNDLGLKGRSMALRDYKKFFDDLAAMQVLHLTLSGGEPLSHPDFFAIGAYARELGFVVRIKSNGHALTAATSRRIRDEIDPFVIESSLHGATAEAHDKQTRVRGSFDRLMKNLRDAKSAGLRLKLNGALTAWNENEVEAMLDLADSLEIPLVIDPAVTPRDNGDREPLGIAASDAGVRRLLHLQAARAKGRVVAPSSAVDATDRGAVTVRTNGTAEPVEKYCGAGSSGVAIDPYGNVYPCVQWRRSVGNLHEQAMPDIWGKSARLAEVRDITRAAKTLVEGAGPSANLMNFCPGAAELHSGNPLEIDPVALRRRELAVAVRDERSRVHLTVVGQARP